MQKHNIHIFIGISLMILFWIIGVPFEFLDSKRHVISMYSLVILILITIVFLFWKTKSITKQIQRIVVTILIVIVSIPYTYWGIYTLIITPVDNPPMWQDISYYSNSNNTKIIYQWRETSGSIYDYRKRKILGDYGKFRISYDYSDRYMHGKWIEYDMKGNKKNIIRFAK